MIEELLAMLEMQEEILQFTRFRDPAPEASGGCYDTPEQWIYRFSLCGKWHQYPERELDAA